MSEENEVEVEIGGSDTGLLAAIAEAKEQLQGFAESINEIKESVSGFGEAFAAAFAIEGIADWVKESAEAGERLGNLAEMTGMSVEGFAELSGQAQLAGISQEAFASSTEKVERAMSEAIGGSKQQQAVFQAIGISMSQLSEMAKNPEEAIKTLMITLGGFKDSANKTALAIALFGRSGAQMIPMMNELYESNGKLNPEMKELKDRLAAMVPEQKENAESIKLMGMSWQVLSTTVESAFMPVIKSVMSTLTTGIQTITTFITTNETLKKVFVDIGIVVHGFVDQMAIEIEIIKQAIDVGTELYHLISDTLVNGFLTFKNAVTSFGATILQYFKDLGQVVQDVASGDFRKAANDIAKTWNELKNNPITTLDNIKDSLTSMANQAVSTFEHIGSEIRATFSGIGSFIVSEAHQGYEAWNKLAEAVKETQEKTDEKTKNAPAMPHTDTGNDKEQVAQWEEILKEKENAAGGSYANLAALDLAYWQNILATCKLTTQEETEVRSKIADAERKVMDQTKEIQKEAANTSVELQKSALEQKKSMLEEEVTAGTITAQQKFTMLKQYSEQEYQLEAQTIDRELALYEKGTLGYQQNLDKRAKLDQQFQNQIQQIDTQSLAEQKKEFDKNFTEIANDFNQMIEGFIRGGNNWRQTLAGILEKELMDFIKIIEQMVAKWLWKETSQTAASTAGTTTRTTLDQTSNDSFIGMLGKQLAEWTGLETTKTATATAGTAATSAANVTQASSAAALAAANALASAAAIPVIGWSMAPGIATEIYADGMGFAALASFAQGAWEIPSDMVANIHQGEMILPRPFAEDFRSKATATSSNNTKNQSVNFSYAPSINHNAPASLEEMLQSHGHVMRRWIDTQVRNGSFK